MLHIKALDSEASVQLSEWTHCWYVSARIDVGGSGTDMDRLLAVCRCCICPSMAACAAAGAADPLATGVWGARYFRSEPETGRQGRAGRQKLHDWVAAERQGVSVRPGVSRPVERAFAWEDCDGSEGRANGPRNLTSHRSDRKEAGRDYGPTA
jgi:hypothetical protein